MQTLLYDESGSDCRAQIDDLQKFGIFNFLIFHNKQELIDKVTKSAENYFLFLENVNSLDLDLEYFLSHVKTESAALVTHEFNHGQELVTIDNDYHLHFVDETEYNDGLVLSNIFYFSKSDLLSYLQTPSLENLNILAIPTPKNQNIIDKKPALFLDRDGIINKDLGYIHSVNNIQLYNEIIPLIKFANQSSWHVFVITNQSGVARGYFSEQDVTVLNQHIDQELKKQDATITDWYQCPFHFDKGEGEFKKRSLMRKPFPGMALSACADYPVDLNRSYMIGDKKSDSLHLPGVNTLHVQRQYDLSEATNPVFKDLTSILEYISKNK